MDSPRESIEAHLLAEKAYNVDHGILRSENAVIDRLIANATSMGVVYDELSRLQPIQWQLIIGAIISTAAFWSPDAINQRRLAAQDLKRLNDEIAKTAGVLADLMDRRAEIEQRNDLDAHSASHPLEWIERAAQHIHLYESWIKEQLAGLRMRFDPRYWPRPSDVVRVIADDAWLTEVTAVDELTAAGLESRQRSIGDFFRPLLVRLSDLHGPPAYLAPAFHLSDAALAEIANCALALEPDSFVSAEQVKKIRHRFTSSNGTTP